jgi:hypothetical protein
VVVPITVATVTPAEGSNGGQGCPQGPSAEIAINRPQVDASIKGALTWANIAAKPGNAGATLFSTHRATKTRANMGIGILPAVAIARRANNQPITSTTGSIKKNAEQLDNDGSIAGCLRHRVSRTDHLRHIVDRRPQHDARGLRIEPKQDADERIKHHRHLSTMH